MDTMKNFDLCTGCDGYTAECTVCHHKRRKRSETDSATKVADYFFDFGPSFDVSESFSSFKNEKKETAVKRRYNSEKAKTVLEKALVCANAHYNDQPDSAFASDTDILLKKCKNVERQIHRPVTISIDFPKFKENAKGSSFGELEELFAGWKEILTSADNDELEKLFKVNDGNDELEKEDFSLPLAKETIISACDTALTILELAKIHNGYVREAWTDTETVLIKFDFFNQKDAEDFKFDWEKVNKVAA